MSTETLKKVTAQATTNGQFIAVYKSAYAASAISGAAYSTVKHAVNGRKSRAFNWTERSTKFMRSKLASNTTTVGQVDATTGELVAVYANTETAARLNGVKPSTIERVLTGGRRTLNGYKFVTA